jgi:hypothetical protein
VFRDLELADLREADFLGSRRRRPGGVDFVGVLTLRAASGRTSHEVDHLLVPNDNRFHEDAARLP